MPDNTIKEKTFCCGSGAGLGSDENMETRLRGGFPKGQRRETRSGKVRGEYGACICAIDKATFPPLLEYWVPGWKWAASTSLWATRW